MVQVPKGAWFPLALTAAIMAVGMTWHHSYIKTLRFHQQHAKQLSALVTPQEPASDRSNPSVYTVSSPAPTLLSSLHAARPHPKVSF